jgi:hypothetical protein
MKTGEKHTETATVTALSVHLDMSRETVARLEKTGVFERRPGGGFDLGQCRLRYLRHLRERRPPGEFRNRFEEARALREERRLAIEAGKLVPLSDFQAFVDQVAHVVMVHIEAIAAKVAGSDLALRRRIEAAVREARAGMQADMVRLGEGKVAR